MIGQRERKIEIESIDFYSLKLETSVERVKDREREREKKEIDR
jgi:hypothetical protein